MHPVVEADHRPCLLLGQRLTLHPVEQILACLQLTTGVSCVEGCPVGAMVGFPSGEATLHGGGL
ncbi:hypothetical protein D9M69_389450 [compost metagenome]